MNKERALRAAASIDTASPGRFQSILPLEPIDRARLTRLRVERLAARASSAAGEGRFADNRRRAQLAARHAIERITASLHACASKAGNSRPALGDAAIHALELQLPESWLPFIVSRPMGSLAVAPR